MIGVIMILVTIAVLGLFGVQCYLLGMRNKVPYLHTASDINVLEGEVEYVWRSPSLYIDMGITKDGLISCYLKNNSIEKVFDTTVELYQQNEEFYIIEALKEHGIIK